MSAVGIFRSREQSEQLRNISKALTGSSSFETLRLSSTSFVTGIFDSIASPNFKLNKENANEQLFAYDRHYRIYSERMPNDYRLRMNYVYILLTQTVLGNDKTKEAKEIIAESYELSSDNPLTYVLDALAHLYSGNIEVAKERAEAALALNPDLKFSQDALAHIKKQEGRFPNVSVLQIENL